MNIRIFCSRVYENFFYPPIKSFDFLFFSLSLLFILIMIMTIFWLIKILHNLIKHTIILKMLEWCTNVCLSHFIDQWSYTRFRSIRHNFFSQIIALDHHIIFFFIAYTLYNVAVYMMSQQQQKKIFLTWQISNRAFGLFVLILCILPIIIIMMFLTVFWAIIVVSWPETTLT